MHLATNCKKNGKTAENCTEPSVNDGKNDNVKLPADATYTVCLCITRIYSYITQRSSNLKKFWGFEMQLVGFKYSLILLLLFILGRHSAVGNDGRTCG